MRKKEIKTNLREEAIREIQNLPLCVAIFFGKWRLLGLFLATGSLLGSFGAVSALMLEGSSVTVK